ncbi:putative U2 small nuclear ribonucleoprotein A' [Toxocara canis]|uniref:Probable U2 small nuclear ribonucleoprotein A' n=1 Tax=Toxocara canis TaxID=6265 RepID=A0A0B2W082_TOXCA|nr:putative U2 small nuclear ribonucleoprotein A' [Toxocara canis]
MVRLTVDLINDSLQYINTVRDRELSLRACKIPVLENLGVTRDQFDTIDLTDNDIRKLENIPLLKRLSSLLMHNNRVQQIMPNLGEVLPSLRTLALTNNNLCELGDIDPLGTCQKLEYLTLIGNPVTHKPQYRLYVIYKVPSVRVLDFKRVRLVERQQAATLFKGKKGQRVREQLVKKSTPMAEDAHVETPKAVHSEDAKKIQEAIASASTLAEVEHLQSILQSGRVPEKGWNLPAGAKPSTAENREKKADGEGFVEEVEEDDEGEDEAETSEKQNVDLNDEEGNEERDGLISTPQNSTEPDGQAEGRTS